MDTGEHSKAQPPQGDDPSIQMRVHRDHFRVDEILHLIEAAAIEGPQSDVLRAMCEQTAVIAHADVVSVYVRESSERGSLLVLRGNVGFPASALGVSLAVGEGIIGSCAEIMQPVSASVAQEAVNYKDVPELDEGRFPSLLAIPLLNRGLVSGVLALQRGESHAFTETEIALATALATTFSGALDRAEAGAPLSRSARLVGTPHSGGGALGRAVVLGTLEGLEQEPQADADAVTAAFDQVAAVIKRAARPLVEALDGADRRKLETYLPMLDDQRLRKTALGHCEQLGTLPGLKQVAREYAAATYVVGDANPVFEERALEVENLCLLVATLLCQNPLPAAGQVLVLAERLTAMTALALLGYGGDGVVIGGPAQANGLGLSIARAGGVPVVAGVPGLFAWARPADTVLVDGDRGVVRVNPPATMIARFRHGK